MKKYSIIKAFTLSLLALSFTGICGCNNESPEFIPTKAEGLEISEIKLSAKSLALSGTSGKTTADLTAKVLPSYVSDKTVYWSSSDSSVVSVSAESGSQVTLTLRGKGQAEVFARSKSGLVVSSCKVYCDLETTAPDPVSDLTPKANANNIYFTWEDPVDYDEDLSYIRLAVENGPYADVPAGVEYGWITGLTPGESYKVKVTAYDFNGNASSVVENEVNTNTELKNFEEGVTLAVPEVSGILPNSFNIGWNANSVLSKEGSSDAVEWNHMDIIVGESDEVYKRIFHTEEAIKVTVDGLEENSSTLVTVNVYNDDFDCKTISKEVRTASYVAELVYDESVTKQYSGYLPVKLENISKDITYSTVKFIIEGKSAPSAVFGSNTSTCFEDLDLESEYSVAASFINASNEEVGRSNILVKKPSKVLWKLISGYKSRTVAHAAVNNKGEESPHVGALEDSDVCYKDRWIVTKPLKSDAGSNYFSLMSSDVNGNGSGKYMWFKPNSTYSSFNGAWSYGGHKAPYALVESPDVISDMAAASFVFGTSSNNSSAYYIKSSSGLKLTHASLIYYGLSTETEDKDGCGDFTYQVSYIK